MSSFVDKINSTYGRYLLLGTDIAFIVASLMRSHLGGFLNEAQLSVGTDGGYPEIFQYAKLAAMVILLCFSAVAERSAVIGGWAVIFSILLADDKLSIHEKGGEKLAEWFSFQPMFYLRAVDYGEMAIFATWGVIAVIILLFTHWIDRSLVAKQISKGLLLSLLGLALCGGFLDMLHIVVRNFQGLSPVGESLFDALEDGGEMVVVSLTLFFVYQKSLKV